MASSEPYLIRSAISPFPSDATREERRGSSSAALRVNKENGIKPRFRQQRCPSKMSTVTSVPLPNACPRGRRSACSGCFARVLRARAWWRGADVPSSCTMDVGAAERNRRCDLRASCAARRRLRARAQGRAQTGGRVTGRCMLVGSFALGPGAVLPRMGRGEAERCHTANPCCGCSPFPPLRSATPHVQ